MRSRATNGPCTAYQVANAIAEQRHAVALQASRRDPWWIAADWYDAGLCRSVVEMIALLNVAAEADARRLRMAHPPPLPTDPPPLRDLKARQGTTLHFVHADDARYGGVTIELQGI